eukprot:TRINITY_DN1404_c0_g1_i2.p1 TRINITY_DN1404_c0_g1~~TRINITY_DN1404_c0_g1_i2.p1  ORF type:complete len:282 (+),score=56.30 TRINITY_DN1404_c0_g1_i2:102-947(+)
MSDGAELLLRRAGALVGAGDPMRDHAAHAKASGGMPLFVRIGGGELLAIEVEADATVLDVAKAAGIDPQRLRWQGEPLSDPNAALSDIGLCAEAVLDADSGTQWLWSTWEPAGQEEFVRSADWTITDGGRACMKTHEPGMTYNLVATPGGVPPPEGLQADIDVTVRLERPEGAEPDAPLFEDEFDAVGLHDQSTGGDGPGPSLRLATGAVREDWSDNTGSECGKLAEMQSGDEVRITYNATSHIFSFTHKQQTVTGTWAEVCQPVLPSVALRKNHCVFRLV